MNPLALTFLTDIVNKVLGAVLPDPQAKAQAQAQAFELIANGTFQDKAEQAIALAQTDVNKAEASNASLFVSGWRPFIGWTLGAALGWDVLLKPILVLVAAYMGHPMPPLPTLSTEQLYTMLFGLLGLGGYRTYEKVKGAS